MSVCVRARVFVSVEACVYECLAEWKDRGRIAPHGGSVWRGGCALGSPLPALQAMKSLFCAAHEPAIYLASHAKISQPPRASGCAGAWDMPLPAFELGGTGRWQRRADMQRNRGKEQTINRSNNQLRRVDRSECCCTRTHPPLTDHRRVPVAPRKAMRKKRAADA